MKSIVAIAILLSLVTCACAQVSYEISGSYTDLNGNSVAYSSYIGKIVFLEAMSTTCPACNDAAHRKDMNTIYDQFNDQVTFLIVSVNSRDTIDTVQTFVNNHNIKWNAGLDDQNALQNRYPIQRTPTTLLLDEGGKLLKTWEGHADISSYINAINNVVSDPIEFNYNDYNNGGGSGGDANSIIATIFASPVFQVSMIVLVVLALYFKATMSKQQ